MLIKHIYLDNFRSYAKRKFEFSPGITLVVGPNTAGKSNLLEAIFLLAFGTSPWAQLDREMVKDVGKLGFVRGFVVHPSGASEEGGRDLEVVLTDNGKRFRVNQVGRRRADFSPHFHVILFSPRDLNLVTGSPDLRRRFLEFALSGIDPRCVRASVEYDKVRKNRNRLLEKINQTRASKDELGFWDAKLLEFGVFLQDKRREFFDEINRDLSAAGLELKYHPSGLTAERLLEFRPKEIAAETSLIGPHRDDFSFSAISREPSAGSERDLAAYGSRGERRWAVLSLKKAELEFVQKRIGRRPVLLLDDIFSELDEENRAGVFDLINGGQGQTIITTTDLDRIPDRLRKGLDVIHL